MVDGDGARSVADFVGICGGDGEGFVGADVKIAGSVTVDVLIRPCRFADHAEQETALLRLNVYGSVLGYIKGVASGHKAFDRSVVYFNNHALGIIDDDIHRCGAKYCREEASQQCCTQKNVKFLHRFVGNNKI